MILANQVLPFEKMELVREGLINYNRLVRRGQVTLASENFGETLYYKAG
jgi:hypothetical protein